MIVFLYSCSRLVELLAAAPGRLHNSSKSVYVGWRDPARWRWGQCLLSRTQCCALPVASAAIFSSPVGRCAAAAGRRPSECRQRTCTSCASTNSSFVVHRVKVLILLSQNHTHTHTATANLYFDGWVADEGVLKVCCEHCTLKRTKKRMKLAVALESLRDAVLFRVFFLTLCTMLDHIQLLSTIDLKWWLWRCWLDRCAKWEVVECCTHPELIVLL